MIHINSKKKIIILSICLLLVIIIGASYAYFVATITGQETTSTLVLNSGTLNINVNGGNSITVNNISPDPEPFITKTITVTGTNTTTNKYMPYKLKLIIDNNTFSDNAISYELLGTNTSNNGNLIPNSSNSLLASDTTKELGTGGFLPGTNQIHIYELKIYFLDTNTDQSSDMNKSFAAHIVIEGGKAYNQSISSLKKGDLITMNVGDGLPNIYRIIKLEGSEALVLAMQDYNVGTTYPYNETSKTTTFGSYTGEQYAGSDLDILLNTTMYGEMNSTAKSAIVAKNINQNIYSWSGEPNELEESEPYTYDYQYQYYWDNNDWDNSNLVGTVNVGSRYVYALDVDDIYEYIGRRYISSSELNEMFFNQNTAYTTNSTMGSSDIWLRSAYSSYSDFAWIVDGYIGMFNSYDSYSVDSGARAAFVIDLSKIEYQKIPEKGDLITMDVGDGLPDTYRVLKLDGTEALVLAMQDYNVGMTYPYNATSKTTTFNGIEGQQYAGSDLDILLNTTMYGEMNSTAKSAIVTKNIDQNMFSGRDAPNELEESEPYTYEYQFQNNWDNNDWDNSDLVGTVNVGSRYVYALDIADIYEYIGRRYIYSTEINEMFFNQNTAYTTNSTMGNNIIWLRSDSSAASNGVYSLTGSWGKFTVFHYYSSNRGVRAAFVIDLSKIEYEEVE